ncbi:MAG: PDZ domain-containing protein, partial [Desulfobacterales bacterium]|nr:PDZ domain-containing protein [Desulfobacterales bacterium]
QQTKPATEHYEELGLKVSELSPEIAKRFGYNKDEKGVVILEVKKGSNAENSDIRAGDMIRGVNNTVIATVEEYRRTVDVLEKGNPVALLIRRPNAGFIVVQLQK